MNYDRIIFFGDNCELGFVLQFFGNNKSQLFRWTRQTIDVALNLLKTNFLNFCQFENLVPDETDLVKDIVFNVGLHLDLNSCLDENGQLNFIESLEQRKIIFQNSGSKVKYLINNFEKKVLDFQANQLFVAKTMSSFNENVHAYAVDVIKNYCKHENFKILFVSQNLQILDWNLKEVSPHILLGELRHIAPFNAVHQCDYKNWKNLLDAALAV